MTKELLIHEARDFFDEAKTDIKEYGFIESASILFCKKNKSIEGLVIRGRHILEKSMNKTKKQAHFDLVMKFVEVFNAIGVIHIGEAWIREKPIINNKKPKGVDELPPSRDPKRMEALVMVISMPGFSTGIIQSYSQIGNRIVFGEEMAFELDGTTETRDYKCLVDVWGSSEDVDEVVSPTASSVKYQTIENIYLQKEVKQ